MTSDERSEGTKSLHSMDQSDKMECKGWQTRQYSNKHLLQNVEMIPERRSSLKLLKSSG